MFLNGLRKVTFDGKRQGRSETQSSTVKSSDPVRSVAGAKEAVVQSIVSASISPPMRSATPSATPIDTVRMTRRAVRCLSASSSGSGSALNRRTMSLLVTRQTVGSELNEGLGRSRLQ
jgi:hypothetical protein